MKRSSNNEPYSLELKAEEVAGRVRTAIDPTAASDRPINPEPIVPFIPGSWLPE